MPVRTQYILGACSGHAQSMIASGTDPRTNQNGCSFKSRLKTSGSTREQYLSRHRTFGINSSKSASRKHFRKLIPQELFSESRYRNLFYECLFYECLFYECLFYECLSSGACLRTWPIFDLENRTWPIFDLGKSNTADFRFSGVEHC